MGFITPGSLAGGGGGSFVKPGAAAEAPETISNLIYWFRADTECYTDLTALTQATDGELVRAIRDKSGTSAEIFPVENDSRRPTYRDSGINSLPTLDFDGIDDRFRLLGANASDFEIERDEAFSWFLVINKVGNPGLFEKDIGGSPAARGYEFLISLTDIVFNLYNTNGVDGVRMVTTGDDVPDSTDLAMLITKSTTPGEAGFSFYVNSTTGVTVGSTYDNALSSTVNTSDLLLGARGSAHFSGDWPEWSFYKKELSAGDISSLMTYAGDRYGITIT